MKLKTVKGNVTDRFPIFSGISHIVRSTIARNMNIRHQMRWRMRIGRRPNQWMMIGHEQTGHQSSGKDGSILLYIAMFAIDIITATTQRMTAPIDPARFITSV